MMKSRTVRTVGRVARMGGVHYKLHLCRILYVSAAESVPGLESNIILRRELQRVKMYGLDKYTGQKKAVIVK
jgi:hypothetical protein